MTEILANITSAKSALDDAHSSIIRTVKEAIVEGLDHAFVDPEVKNVVFGVSTDPFNDENTGQGVFGPTVNALSHDDDFSHDDEYALFYDGRGYGANTSDGPTKLLGEVLGAAGWKFAGEALNVSYWEDEGHGQTTAFVARRRDDKGAWSLEEHSIGY